MNGKGVQLNLFSIFLGVYFFSFMWCMYICLWFLLLLIATGTCNKAIIQRSKQTIIAISSNISVSPLLLYCLYSLVDYCFN